MQIMKHSSHYMSRKLCYRVDVKKHKTMKHSRKHCKTVLDHVIKTAELL